MENISQNKIEQEIVELTRMIELKRNQLEAGHGIIEEKEIVRGHIAEKLNEASAIFAQQQQARSASVAGGAISPTASYLDSLNDEAVGKLNKYIEIAFEKGVEKAVKEVENESPDIIDAFHDALVDKFYDELKSRGVVK